MSNTIVLATGNKGKVAELANMLAPLDKQVLPQSEFDVPEVPETGTTFVENAIIKARHAARITGLPAIADDSGSSRGCTWRCTRRLFGPLRRRQLPPTSDNVDKLLDALKDVDQRTVVKPVFLCVLVFMRHADDPTPIICQGEWHGSITLSPQGSAKVSAMIRFSGLSRKAKQLRSLSKEVKNKLSHRGQALSHLITRLENPLG